MLADLGVNDLSIYPELGLVVFLAVFVAVTIRALRKPRGEIDECARMPLDETTAGVEDTKQQPRGA